MFGPNGQRDHLTFGGMRGGGGGKGGGGGQSAPPVQPNYTDPVTGKQYEDVYGPDGKMQASAQSMLNAAISDRMSQSKIDSDAATAASDQKTADARTAFDTSKASAIGTGRQNVLDYFTRQGVDYTPYQDQIESGISTATQGIPDLSPNPISAFPDTLGARIFGDLQSGRQNQASDALSRIFGANYSQDQLPDTADDAAIQTVLNGQFDPLSAQLENAHKRHSLNDTGYNAALTRMGQDKTAATSTLNTLGSGILGNYRNALDSYVSGAKNQAANLTLGTADEFDPNAFSTGAQGKVSSDLSNITGDLTNAVGKTTFSDLPSLLNAGGSVQGANDPTAQNPNSSGVPSPNFIADQVLANTKRGLGTQGAF